MKYKLKDNPCLLEYNLEKYDTHTEVYIDYIFTPEQYRNKGYATHMLTKFIKTMSKYDRVYLFASGEFGIKLSKLIQFYKKFGFKIKIKNYCTLKWKSLIKINK